MKLRDPSGEAGGREFFPGKPNSNCRGGMALTVIPAGVSLNEETGSYYRSWVVVFGPEGKHGDLMGMIIQPVRGRAEDELMDAFESAEAMMHRICEGRLEDMQPRGQA